MSGETEEKKQVSIEPLISPPDGCSPSMWERDLIMDAVNQERARFVDEALPGFWRERARRQGGKDRDEKINRIKH